jgi:hypothetical protein
MQGLIELLMRKKTIRKNLVHFMTNAAGVSHSMLREEFAVDSSNA